jgi:hypothetical protein
VLLYFNDDSFGDYSDFTGSTFEIRWSTSPLTSANFSAATPINPLYYAGVGCTSCITRPDTWSLAAYTEFQIPSGTATNSNVIYVGIRDISVPGGHVAGYPLQNGDGRSPLNSNIYTIDYRFRP